MKVRVLKELPQGQEPGQIIEVTDDEAKALMVVKAVEPVDGDSAEPAGRRRYRRRDLVAQD